MRAWQSRLRVFPGLTNLDDHGSESGIAGEKDLVGRACGNVGDVAGAEVPARASFDRGPASFAWAYVLEIADRAPADEGGSAVQNKEDVGEGLVQFGDAAAQPDGKLDVVPRVLFEDFAGRTFAEAGELAQVGDAFHKNRAGGVVDRRGGVSFVQWLGLAGRSWFGQIAKDAVRDEIDVAH